MGHVQDLWMKRDRATGKKVRSARWGKGKRWQARWTDPLGNEPTRLFVSQDAALKHVSKMEVDVGSGTYIDPKGGRVTFQSYAEEWLSNQLHHRESTREQAESRLRLWAYPVIGDKPIGAVDRRLVQELVKRASASLAPSTVEVAYAYVASVFKSAVKDKLIVASPCVDINLPEIKKRKVTPLLTEQVSKIALAVPDRYRAAVLVAAASGLRQGELFGLTVDRITGPCDNVTLVIDRQRGYRSTEWGPPKTDAGDREVEIGLLASRALWHHLVTYGEGIQGHVFSNPRRTAVGKVTAGDVWRAATSGMELWPRSGWHDLRHYFASLLIFAGLSVADVADILGHQDQKETLETYSHLWPGARSRAAGAVDRALSLL